MKPPHEPSSTKAPAADRAPLAESEKRKPYAPPAIQEEEAFDAVTLGTMPPVNAHFAC